MPEVSLTSGATSPSNVFNVRTQNRDFSTQALSSDEADLLQEQFNTLLSDFDSRHVSSLYADRANVIAQSAAYAKSQFDGKLFGGVNASDNEIAFDVIRPGHVRSDPSTGSVVNNWSFEPSTEGWNDWIGDGTSANDYSVDEDQVTVVVGFMDQADTSEVSAVNVDRFGRNVDMLPKDLYDARSLDNENNLMIQALPAMVASDRDRLHLRLRHDAVQTSQPRLLGVTFGVGDYMNQEDF